MKITLEINKSQLGYIMGCNELNIHVAKDTIQEAFQEFAEQFDYFNKYYNRLQYYEVMGEAKILKNLYSEFKEE